MKAVGHPHLVSVILLFTTLAASWPWPAKMDNFDGSLERRQDSSSQSNAVSTSATDTAQETESTNVSTSGTITEKPTPTDSSSGSGSGSGSAAATSGGSAAATSDGSASSNSTATTKKSSATTAIDPRLPPGGIEMVTPAAIAPASYYKIGNFVTFAWNYTSLSVTPSAIDVMVSCSANSQTYTIAMNQSVAPTGAVTWDTGKYQSSATVPLLTETYTLVIYDAAKDISATAQAGYLGAFDQFTFGMYTPQPYTPLNEFKCATCSGALSDMERHALGFMLSMGIITVLSFTWFAGGMGVFS